MPGDADVDGVGDEPRLCGEFPPQPVDARRVLMMHGAASVAHQVDHGVAVCALPGGGVTEAGFAHELDLGEQRQGPVDRGQVDAGVEGLDLFGELVGVEMTVGGGEDLPDDAARPGDAMPVLAQRGLEIHGGQRRRRPREEAM